MSTLSDRQLWTPGRRQRISEGIELYYYSANPRSFTTGPEVHYVQRGPFWSNFTQEHMVSPNGYTRGAYRPVFTRPDSAPRHVSVPTWLSACDTFTPPSNISANRPPEAGFSFHTRDSRRQADVIP